MIKFTERFGVGLFFIQLLWSLSLLSLDIQAGKGKKKKGKKEQVINKELTLGELIKYEYHSKELNVS